MEIDKSIIIYNNIGGVNHKVSKTLSNKLKIQAFSVSETRLINLEHYNNFIFVCPNIGDEEIPNEFENFFINLNINNRFYSLCELGNYFGYEQDYFGCRLIIEKLLNNLHWKEILNISIDSFPKLDNAMLNKWILKLKEQWI